jgi:hypothetical protein
MRPAEGLAVVEQEPAIPKIERRDRERQVFGNCFPE